MSTLLIFTILQIINVILSVTKSIIQVKGTKTIAAIFNAVYFSFYSVVVIYMVADIDIWIKMIITFISNLIGTYIAMTLLEKLRKDRLWKIELTVPTNAAEMIHTLTKSVPHTYITITGRRTVFTFYCATREDSLKVREIADQYNAKYFITENMHSLY